MYELSLFGCFLFQYQVVLMDFMKRKLKNSTRVFNCEIQFHDLFRRNSHYFHLIVRSLIYTLSRLTTMNTFGLYVLQLKEHLLLFL